MTTAVTNNGFRCSESCHDDCFEQVGNEDLSWNPTSFEVEEEWWWIENGRWIENESVLLLMVVAAAAVDN